MQEKMFGIKIGEREFVVDDKLEEFREISKSSAAETNSIPIGQFRYKDGSWYILWDKEFASYYNPNKPQQCNPIPLSVEWAEVKFFDDKAPEKDYLDMIILLSETLCILRNRNSTNRFRKSDANLKKIISQFNKS